MLQSTPSAARGQRVLTQDPLVVPQPSGYPGEIALYPRTGGQMQGNVPHLLDTSMTLPGSLSTVGAWKPQDGKYELGTIPNQSSLVCYFNADDLDANYTYNSNYPVGTYSNPLTNGSTFYYPPQMINGWTNNLLASGGSVASSVGAGAAINSSTGEVASDTLWQQGLLMHNNINGRCAVRTASTNAPTLEISGSNASLSLFHNTADFELMIVARCHYDYAPTGATESFQPPILASSNAGGPGGFFAFYQGTWVCYASTSGVSGGGAVFNGYSGPSYKAGEMAIYGAYGNGSNVYSYINNGSTHGPFTVTGYLGSGLSPANPNSANNWYLGYDPSGSRGYPFDIACILIWSSAFPSALARSQMLGQLNRYYHIY